MNDLGTLLMKQETTRRWRAEHENAGARLDLAGWDERMAQLISQHNPVASMGLDRERLRLLLDYIRHGDMQRLDRELVSLRQS